jgi:heme exporter protein B
MFWIILQQDLLLFLKNSAKIIASFLFFIIFIVIFFLLSQAQESQALEPSIAIWLALLSSLIFSSSEFLKKDFEDGSLEQMLIIFPNFEIFILSKIIANWLIYCLPMAFLAYFIKMEVNFLILFLLASFAINSICCFCGSLSVAGGVSSMIAIIALPLIIPVILISYGDFWTSFNLLLGISALLLVALSFATAKIIKVIEE